MADGRGAECRRQRQLRWLQRRRPGDGVQWDVAGSGHLCGLHQRLARHTDLLMEGPLRRRHPLRGPISRRDRDRVVDRRRTGRHQQHDIDRRWRHGRRRGWPDDGVQRHVAGPKGLCGDEDQWHVGAGHGHAYDCRWHRHVFIVSVPGQPGAYDGHGNCGSCRPGSPGRQRVHPDCGCRPPGTA